MQSARGGECDSNESEVRWMGISYSENRHRVKSADCCDCNWAKNLIGLSSYFHGGSGMTEFLSSG